MTARLSPDKVNLLWLEDRESTARIELGEARKLGCQVHVRAHPGELMAILEEEFESNCEPKRLEELVLPLLLTL